MRGPNYPKRYTVTWRVGHLRPSSPLKIPLGRNRVWKEIERTRAHSGNKRKNVYRPHGGDSSDRGTKTRDTPLTEVSRYRRKGRQGCVGRRKRLGWGVERMQSRIAKWQPAATQNYCMYKRFTASGPFAQPKGGRGRYGNRQAEARAYPSISPDASTRRLALLRQVILLHLFSVPSPSPFTGPLSCPSPALPSFFFCSPFAPCVSSASRLHFGAPSPFSNVALSRIFACPTRRSFGPSSIINSFPPARGWRVSRRWRDGAEKIADDLELGTRPSAQNLYRKLSIDERGVEIPTSSFYRLRRTRKNENRRARWTESSTTCVRSGASGTSAFWGFEFFGAFTLRVHLWRRFFDRFRSRNRLLNDNCCAR